MSDNFENKNYQIFNRNGAQTGTQNNAQNQKVKLRLRLKTGEEFEAEGSLPFVLEQKEDFLTKNAPHFNKPRAVQQQLNPSTENAPNTVFTPQNNIQTEQIEGGNILEEPQDELQPAQPSQPESTRVTPAEYNLHIPAIRRRQLEAEAKQIQSAAVTAQPTDGQNWQIDAKIWSKIAYLDGTDIVLRRKVRDLKPNLAALITLAAAKMLAGITKMSALELSKSLKMSGYLRPTERLDRIIAAEIKAGTLFFEGSKRNREYIISQTGTAKAYTAAEHFLL